MAFIKNPSFVEDGMHDRNGIRPRDNHTVRLKHSDILNYIIENDHVIKYDPIINTPYKNIYIKAITALDNIIIGTSTANLETDEKRLNRSLYKVDNLQKLIDILMDPSIISTIHVIRNNKHNDLHGLYHLEFDVPIIDEKIIKVNKKKLTPREISSILPLKEKIIKCMLHLLPLNKKYLMKYNTYGYTTTYHEFYMGFKGNKFNPSRITTQMKSLTTRIKKSYNSDNCYNIPNTVSDLLLDEINSEPLDSLTDEEILEDGGGCISNILEKVEKIK